MPKFWIGVASKEHVENGVKLGICQFCHGKLAPAKRPKLGDFIIYYSSKVKMHESKVYQKFTAIGIITDDMPYKFDMGGEFQPYRRNVKYFEGKHTDIKPLINSLSFIKNKDAWGAVFRYGFLEIDRESFEIIAKEMLDESFIQNLAI
ncbi:Putative conserved hypothetical protein [Candidatus Fokinia solitaria]|uniref:UPF0310 protein Fsol_00311 n=1 Tax=Candidatus Fokinia solitaria TaxID=1802984 RepID=A0A2U8BS53_9RICK|nr:EVE domain-containing protein [Candidatus Fokinia solitaria]AWD33110.1 Putative conserved hypothetical protein [Candidatus Fokinia solitaria]